jgi:hypothetical protein
MAASWTRFPIGALLLLIAVPAHGQARPGNVPGDFPPRAACREQRVTEAKATYRPRYNGLISHEGSDHLPDRRLDFRSGPR